MVQVKTCLGCANLQWRGYSSSSSGRVPWLGVSDQATISANPRDAHLRNAITKMKTRIKVSQSFITEIGENVNVIREQPFDSN